MKYKIRAAAERDLDEAASWYGEHAVDPRTPLRFLLEVRAAFELIAESPGAFAEIHGDIRRCPVRLSKSAIANSIRRLRALDLVKDDEAGSRRVDKLAP